MYFRSNAEHELLSFIGLSSNPSPNPFLHLTSILSQTQYPNTNGATWFLGVLGPYSCPNQRSKYKIKNSKNDFRFSTNCGGRTKTLETHTKKDIHFCSFLGFRCRKMSKKNFVQILTNMWNMFVGTRKTENLLF